MRVIPCELSDANAYVAALHRHHDPAVGHRFSLAAIDDDGTVRGVAIVGRPVARMLDQRSVIEVARCCTDGTFNACSILYGAAARVAQAMGFQIIQTYTLPEEGGASLRAVGWIMDEESPGGEWIHTSGPRTNSHPLGVKNRWRRELNPPIPPVDFGVPDASTDAPLFAGANP